MKIVLFAIGTCAAIFVGCTIVHFTRARHPIRREYVGSIVATAPTLPPAPARIRVFTQHACYIVPVQTAPIGAPVTITVWSDGTRSICWPGIGNRYYR
jgi:hypothetical protein